MNLDVLCRALAFHRLFAGRAFLPAAVAVLGTMVGVPHQLQAQSEVVVPPAYDRIQGNSNNCIPFSTACFSSTATARYQQVYAASAFDGLSGVIDKIVFRIECGYPGIDISDLDVEIRLSHTDVIPNPSTGGLSSVFAANVGSDETLVLADPGLSLAGTAGGTTCPVPWDLEIDVDDTFVYDGVSSLLLDIRIFGGSLQVPLDATWNNTDPDAGVTARIAAFYFDSAVDAPNAMISGPYGLVTKFVLKPEYLDQDSDGDGVLDSLDNCAAEPNPGQQDTDADGTGDICDDDSDGDLYLNFEDNCSTVFNPDQIDSDGDGYGDACVPPHSLFAGASGGAGLVVGANSRLLQGVELGDNALIGDNVVIHKNLFAADNLIVGDDVDIGKNVEIGNDVTIGDNVWIGNGVVIGRGVTIEEGARIENDVVIGDYVLIGAAARVERSVEIGAYAEVGAGASIGMGAAVAPDAVVADGNRIKKFALVE